MQINLFRHLDREILSLNNLHGDVDGVEVAVSVGTAAAMAAMVIVCTILNEPSRNRSESTTHHPREMLFQRLPDGDADGVV